SSKQSTARDLTDATQLFRVTHPFHPLYGREFMLVERRKAWGEDRVYFHDDMGNLKRMAAGWTSAAPPNAFETVSAGRSHFRIEDLLQLTMLIARYREPNGHSKGHTGKRKLSRK
ncbi:DUF5372 family protein, partial [Paraburkholderia sediminicola]|uniref:DUF5372 family protein n=1 Tax=Paraburkholderia sediminicola TaxID=458836 RepID=UPI0038B807BB